MPAKNLVRRNEEGIYSHIYNKGVEKRILFNDAQDYAVFLGFLKDYLTAPQDPESIKKSFTVHGRVFRGTPHQPKNYLNQIELIAYSLMPNHFHLILRQKTRGSLESFIRSLCTRYSIYFNKKYKRTGALFEGPYKSVQVEDEPRLLLLTRYIHLAQDYSSYAEYLGTREASWVKSKVVQSFFEKVKTDLFKGADSYKDFVEKYVLGQKENELLEGITFEGYTQHLERRGPPKDAGNYLSDSNFKPLQRIPEIAIITVVFLLLLTIGMRNIMVSTTKSPKLFTLGVSSEVSTTKSPSPSTTPPVPLPTEEIQPKIVLTIRINDASASASVNIRQEPTTNSEKIGKARDGDTFEHVSEDSDWYEVRLADGKTGFISGEFIVKEETDK